MAATLYQLHKEINKALDDLQDTCLLGDDTVTAEMILALIDAMKRSLYVNAITLKKATEHIKRHALSTPAVYRDHLATLDAKAADVEANLAWLDKLEQENQDIKTELTHNNIKPTAAYVAQSNTEPIQ